MRATLIRLSLRTKTALAAVGIASVLLAVLWFVLIGLQRSSDQIIASNRLVTETAAHQLSGVGRRFIDSLVASGFFSKSLVTRAEERAIDSTLSAISSRLLGGFEGMEGGFYFPQTDGFIGYSFPTSPPPKPAFGPPPRSYDIIRDQARLSATRHEYIVKIHGFDPAQFPLATEPIYGPNGVIACSWTRVHIERLIPTLRLTDVLVFAGGVSLIGFIILLWTAWRMRQHVEYIRLGLEALHTDESYRFRSQAGVFGEITRSINEMIEARSTEQHRRKSLEENLHQQEKMAALGRLIAGVAHEVKTPLAIIKTRIQLWQRQVKNSFEPAVIREVFSSESLEMVVREINRLSDLVRRLLIFSKPVRDRLRPGDINLVISQAESFIRPTAEARSVSIDLSLGEDVPPVMLDTQAMEQVFLNILGNSVEAMTEGGIIRVISAVENGGAEIVVDIIDGGPGIPPEVIGTVFNPFFTTKEHGVGLGLSISYEIVRAHRGDITFIQNSEAGAHCRLVLPSAKH